MGDRLYVDRLTCMIDPRLLRDDPESLRVAQRRRGEPTQPVDEAVAADERRRAAIAAVEKLRAEQKAGGARFYYLTGVGAQLELALTHLAMNKAAEWGFTPMIPPALVKPSAMEGTGFLGQAADDVYRLAKDDLYLVGTSEVPLAAYHG